MENLEKYLIKSTSSVIDVLKKINALPSILTIFVEDNDNKVIGTITDGDIRRGLINGLTLDTKLEEFIFTEFSFLIDGEDNFNKLEEFRKRKLTAIPLLNKNRELINIYNFAKIKSILPIDAVIMAGGEGVRLRPLTENTPKPLLKVGGKEIISYNFDRLFQYGIENQYITVNFLGEQISDYCRNYNKEINFSIIKEDSFLGTAGALSLVKSFENDIILLMNSDLLTNIDYEDFYKAFVNKNADMMVASIPYEVNLPYAILETDDSNVKSFKEKPNHTYFANAGIYLFKKELLNLIPENKVYNATDFMEDVIAQNMKLVHYPIRGYWLDIGKHNDFEKAQKDIAHINWE